MKHISRLLTVTMLGLSIAPLSARQLTPDEALSRISPTEMSRIKAATAHSQLQLKSTGYDDAGNAAYYIFSAGDRTLFASADDVAAPLLGYVISSDFNVDDMAPAMQWWLSEYAREIAWAVANGIKPYAATNSDDRTSIPPLVSTTWNQGAPYNDLCPLKNGKRTYTGCVATSTAQVMNYHKWPVTGTGTVSYEWNDETLSMDLGSTTFSWGDMLDNYPTADAGTEAERQAVATLMKACGYALHMTYGLDEDNGSGAYSSDIANVLSSNFGYDAAVHYELRDFYAPDQWEQMIYDNLAKIGPLIYGGRGSAGGHSFVCDGYDADGYFHINWGWGGASDDYFRLSALNPSSLGAGGGAGGFNSNQNATLGIRKPQSGSVKPLPYIGCPETSRILATINDRTISVAAEQNMPPYLFYNVGSSEGVFTYGLRLVDESDADKAVIVASDNVQSHKLAPGSGFAVIDVTIPEDMSDGIYKAYPVYKLADTQWEDIKLPYNITKYVGFTIENGKITIDPESAPPSIYIKSFSCPTGLIIGMPYTIDLNVSSTYAASKDCEFEAELLEAPSGFWYDSLGTSSATVAAGETATVTITGTLSNSIPEGNYYISILETLSGELGRYPVTVTDSSNIDETAEDGVDAANFQWYDLSGRPVEPESLSQGIYIKTDGLHTEKVTIK